MGACEGRGGGTEEILRLLKEDGSGEGWMRRLQERREGRKVGGKARGLEKRGRNEEYKEGGKKEGRTRMG